LLLYRINDLDQLIIWHSAMGTRNLTCVYHKGRFVIVQYCQWDGYPEGQGQVILMFLRESGNIERLKEGLQYLITLTEEGMKQLENAIQHDLESQPTYIEDDICMTVGDKIVSLWPSLSRDTGAKILEIVAHATAEKRVPIFHDLGFANSFTCEWAYIVDLDQNTFQVFAGIENKQEAPTTRFSDVGGEDDTVPILIQSFSLSQLPATEEEFIDAIENSKAFRRLNAEYVEDEEDENEGENNKEEVDKEEGIGDIGNTSNTIQADK